MRTNQIITSLAVAALAAPSYAALIGWNAEDGSSNSGTVAASLGADFDPPLADASALGGAYITTETTGGGGTPGSAARLASYDVTFTAAGDYDLYARLYIGPGGGDDDSMFYARAFGETDPTNDGTPIAFATVNGLSDVAGIPVQEYFWVNLSQETGDFGEGPSNFTVGAPGTLTYEIGAREDGLRIDALAFGTTGETFTNEQLNNSVVIPEPGSLALLGLGGLLIARRRRD